MTLRVDLPALSDALDDHAAVLAAQDDDHLAAATAAVADLPANQVTIPAADVDTDD